MHGNVLNDRTSSYIRIDADVVRCAVSGANADTEVDSREGKSSYVIRLPHKVFGN
jgi:hypothetical protein